MLDDGRVGASGCRVQGGYVPVGAGCQEVPGGWVVVVGGGGGRCREGKCLWVSGCQEGANRFREGGCREVPGLSGCRWLPGGGCG